VLGPDGQPHRAHMAICPHSGCPRPGSTRPTARVPGSRGFFPGDSGGTAPDSHRLPLLPSYMAPAVHHAPGRPVNLLLTCGAAVCSVPHRRNIARRPNRRFLRSFPTRRTGTLEGTAVRRLSADERHWVIRRGETNLVWPALRRVRAAAGHGARVVAVRDAVSVR
jgi:hypothetical protein